MARHQIKAGDLCFFTGGHNHTAADGMINHATMITKVADGGLYYSGHTVNRINKELKFGDLDPGTVVHIIKMSR